ncbi:hypothetical protein HDZ31DRAFT_61498 [Schizophyllum fasciatum]
MAQAYNAYHKPYARRIDEDVAVPQAPQPTHAPQPPQQPQPHQTLYPTPRSPPPARTHESRADLYQRPPHHAYQYPDDKYTRRDSNHSDADDELIPDHRLYVETPLHGDAVRLNLRRGFSKVLFPMLAVFSSIAFVVGCGAAAGTTLLLVGRPLFDWVRYGGGGDSGAGDSVFDEPRSLSPLRPLHVARAGAAGGVLACVVPCFLFFMTEVSFSGGPLHARRRRLFERLVRRVWGRGAARSIRNDFARDAQVGRNLNVVIYLVVSLVFAACVGVWAFVLGMEGAGTGAGTGRERTVAATMAEAVAAAMVGWAVLHVGCLGVVGVTVAAKWVPRRVMEGVGWL